MCPSFLDMSHGCPSQLFCLETYMKTYFYMSLYIPFCVEIVVVVVTSSDAVFYFVVLDIVSVYDLKSVFVVMVLENKH